MGSLTELEAVAKALEMVAKEIAWASVPLWFMAAAVVGYMLGRVWVMARGD